MQCQPKIVDFSLRMNSMSRIRGRVCVVCGGSTGIGRAICVELAKQGGRVIVIGRDSTKALQTAHFLRKFSPLDFDYQQHESFGCDLTDYSLVETTVSEIESTVGAISVLVNAAGVNKDALLLRTKLNDIDKLIKTNLLGSIHSCKAVMKSMVQRREGSIVNVGSIVGITGLVGFTKSLAKEVAPKGVCVNLVAPGLVETRMTADLMSSEKGASYKALIPLKRFGKPIEIANGVCFLVQSSHITGQVLAIDGGLQLVM